MGRRVSCCRGESRMTDSRPPPAPGKGWAPAAETGQGSKSDASVKVICRFRPMNAREIHLKTSTCIQQVNESTLNILDGPDSRSAEKRSFTYDRVFGDKSTQAEVFELCGRPIVLDVLKGYNGTIFAYGQTGSGKTFTMEGPDVENQETQGMIPRCIDTIFETIETADQFLSFTIAVSYIEIYMEKIRDLLDPTRDNLQIKKKETEIGIDGATEVYISSIDEIMDTLHIGARNRAQASTNMNATSSRSHSVFITTITQKNEKNGTVVKGKLYLVDLAGSEKIRKTGASGARLDEAKTINTSLSALGLVIKKLTDENASHIPYRDSKLTRLLEESLGGNAKTALVICCSPSSDNHDETVSTLRFGERAKKVKNKARVNQERTSEELMRLLRQAQKAILMLEKKVSMLETELNAYKGTEQPVVKKTPGHNRRLTTGDIGKVGPTRKKRASDVHTSLESVDSDAESSSGEDSDSSRNGGNDVKQLLAVAENELRELKDETQALKEQLEHYQSKTSELQLEQANTKGELQVLQEKAVEAERVAYNEAGAAKEATEQLEALRAHVVELEKEKADVEREFESTKKGNLAMLESQSEMEAKIRTAEEAVKEQQNLVTTLEAIKFENEENILQNSELIETLENKISEGDAALQKASQNREEDGKKMALMAKRLEEAAIAKEDVEKAQAKEHTKYVEELSLLKSKLEEKKEREAELRAEVDRTKGFEGHCEELKRALEQAEAKHESRIASLQSKHSGSIQNIAVRAAKAEAINAQLEEKIEKCNSDMLLHAEKYTKLEGEETKLRETHAAEIARKDEEYASVCREHEAELRKQRRVNDESRAQVEKGSQQIADLTATTAENEKRIEELVKEVEAANKKKVEMQVQITKDKLSSTQEREALTSELKTVKLKLSELKEQVREGKDFEEKSRNLEQSLLDLKESHETKIKRLGDDLKDVTEASKKSLEEKDAEIKRLKEAASKLEHECATGRSYISSLESEKEETQQLHTTTTVALEGQIKEAQAKLSSAQNSFLEKAKAADEKQEELQKNINSMQAKISSMSLSHKQALENSQELVRDLENKCEAFLVEVKQAKEESHSEAVKHQENVLALEVKFNDKVSGIQELHAEELKLKNEEINTALRAQDERNVEHASLVEKLNAALRSSEAEAARARAHEENMKIASSEKIGAVQQELMGRLDQAQKELQAFQEKHAGVEAERNRFRIACSTARSDLSESQGAQKALLEQLRVYEGVKESLATETNKVQVLETRLEERVGEVKMERDRAVRAEELLASEKREFQVLLQNHIDAAKEALESEQKRGQEQAEKLEHTLKEKEAELEASNERQRKGNEAHKRVLEEKEALVTELVKSHKNELVKANEKLDQERSIASKGYEEFRKKLQDADVQMSSALLKHSNDRNEWSVKAKQELDQLASTEASKRKDLVRTLTENKTTAMDELRQQLNKEKQEAITNCMQTTMAEMQKALKDASSEKEVAISTLRNEWKDKVSELMLKHNEDIQKQNAQSKKMEEVYERKLQEHMKSLEISQAEVNQLRAEAKEAYIVTKEQASSLMKAEASLLQATQRIEELQVDLESAYKESETLTAKFSEEKDQLLSKAALDLEKLGEEDSKTLENKIAEMREEKSEALKELRQQLSAEKQRAVSNCMETTMDEMQKALRKAAKQKEEAVNKVRVEWKENLADQLRKSKVELERRIALCHEETKKEVAALRQSAGEELKKRLEEQKEDFRLEKGREIFEIEARHEADLEVQEKELRETLTEEFRMQQSQSANQTKQMLFKLGHNDASKRTAYEKALEEKKANKKSRFSWLSFGRTKEESELFTPPGTRRTAHRDSAQGADDIVVGGDLNPFDDPNLPEKYAASCETVAALMIQVQEHAEMTMKKIDENENLKEEVEVLKTREATMKNTLNIYNAKISRLMRGNVESNEETVNKMTKLESSCQELTTLVRNANKENQQLKVNIEILTIKSSRKDKQISDMEETIKSLKSSESKVYLRPESKGKLVVPLRGGGSVSSRSATLSGGDTSPKSGTGRRRSYSKSETPSPAQRDSGNQEVVSAGSETPFAFEVMSPAVEGKLQAKTSGEASKPPSFSSFDFAADEFQ